MREKIKLGVLTALIALLAMGVTAWAAQPPSGEAEPTDFDIYRTGIPDYDLVWQFYTEFDIGSLEHLPRAGVPRPDGYYWVIVRQEERDTIDQMVEELQRIMGDDFPVAVSVSSPAPIDEAAMREVIGPDDIEWGKADIYRTGTPDHDLVKEFYKGFDVRNLKHWSVLIVAAGARRDGYYWLLVREQNWDAIHHTVKELQQIMGEDFPIALEVGEYRPGGTITADNTTIDEPMATSSNDVCGGHRSVVQTGLLSWSRQTLAFAATPGGGGVGMVLTGYFGEHQAMPLGGWVYSPTSWWPFVTNRIGIIDRVGGDYSDSSYMRPAWPGSDRIEAGVQHYGSHMPVWSWEDPEVGDYVFKTGRTTGTTLGRVLAFVQVDCPIHGLLDAQAVASYNNAPGDSGAPVYWVQVIHYPIPNGWWPPDPEFAILKGVDTGQITYQGVPRAVFSTMTQVMDDLDVWPLPGPF